jgi:hypothetical protein
VNHTFEAIHRRWPQLLPGASSIRLAAWCTAGIASNRIGAAPGAEASPRRRAAALLQLKAELLMLYRGALEGRLRPALYCRLCCLMYCLL